MYDDVKSRVPTEVGEEYIWSRAIKKEWYKDSNVEK